MRTKLTFASLNLRRWKSRRSISVSVTADWKTACTRSRCSDRAHSHPRHRRERTSCQRTGRPGKVGPRIRRRMLTRQSAGWPALFRTGAGCPGAGVVAQAAAAWVRWLWAPCAGRMRCAPWRVAAGVSHVCAHEGDNPVMASGDTPQIQSEGDGVATCAGYPRHSGFPVVWRGSRRTTAVSAANASYRLADGGKEVGPTRTETRQPVGTTAGYSRAPIQKGFQ